MQHAFIAILLYSLWSAYMLSTRIETYNPILHCNNEEKCAVEATTTTTTTTRIDQQDGEADEKPPIILHEEENVVKKLRFCSRAQRQKIRHQLQPWFCRETKDQPYKNECSFTRATKCPEQTWLIDYFKNLSSSKTSSTPFVGISVGCNKGFDAIDTMRMGTGNTAFDKERWREAMTSHGNEGSTVKDDNNSSTASTTTTAMDRGVCRQDKSEQIDVSSWEQISGEMYCIEPLTVTYERLEKAANSMELNLLGFTVSHYAVAKESGKALFPKTHIGDSDLDYLRVNVGTENKGLGNCDEIKNTEKRMEVCEEVDVISLDEYVHRHLQSKGPIHALNIDVEGYDFDVLLGAREMLKRTQYVEFEYNWKGSWANQHLKDAIQMLDDLNFTCYWAGRDKLWKITRCWWDYFDFHHWSNVACVKNSQIKLAIAMENLFTKTLQDDKFHLH
eukprot:CAMPEP_0116008266 /NCGR_PEP_ID=MMETSP0321-20121206/2766_1 /TAXON_ID=163516 /ORGANISM="Leptocylindrus danicus var. danicus, Strain B650" /LENGTH=445 /DNA_ID=CAMNT_0003477067 /DNA_START=1 /DNA_END=1338 /DNA_ORIENTATION=-